MTYQKKFTANDECQVIDQGIELLTRSATMFLRS